MFNARSGWSRKKAERALDAPGKIGQISSFSLSSWDKEVCWLVRSMLYNPTNPFSILKPQNPSMDVSVLHKVWRYMEFGALEL